MTTTAYDRVIDAFRRHGLTVDERDGKAQVQAPGHSIRDRSVSIAYDTVECKVLLNSHADNKLDVLHAVGLTLADLFDDRAEYRYSDGRNVFRLPGKKFRQSGNTKGKALFRAERLTDDDELVYVTEGEKCALHIEAAGGVAVCAAMGAGKARLADWSPVYGKNVIIVADNDKPGHAHARQVFELLDGHCQSLRIVSAKTGKDAADHIAARHKLHDFVPLDDQPEGAAERVRPWPLLPDAALYGLAGEYVRGVDRYTEADRAAVLIHFLAEFAALIGPAYWDAPVPYVMANSEHHPVIHALKIGPTATGRKGTAAAVARLAFRHSAIVNPVIQRPSSLVSGEGLIDCVQDQPAPESDDDRHDAKHDKRVLVYSEEYTAVLSASGRDGSTIPQMLREAWDGTPMFIPRASGARRATRHHIVVLGDVTPGEFAAKVRATDLAGGTWNRFLFFCCRQSKVLAGLTDSQIPGEVIDGFARRIAMTITKVAGTTEVKFTAAADRLYRDSYDVMNPGEGVDGPLSQVLTRGRPQVIRLALIYALLDASTVIDEQHLQAALALWQYSTASAAWQFDPNNVGDGLDEDRQAVVKFMTENPGWLSKTDIRAKVFANHKTGEEVDAILSPMVHDGTLERLGVKTGGRPRADFRLRGKRGKRSKSETAGQGLNPSAQTPARKPAQKVAKTPVPKFQVLTAHVNEHPNSAERSPGNRSSDDTEGLSAHNALYDKDTKKSDPTEPLDLPIEVPAKLTTTEDGSTPVLECQITGCAMPGNPLCGLHDYYRRRILARAMTTPGEPWHHRKLREALRQPYPKRDECKTGTDGRIIPAYQPVLDYMAAVGDLEPVDGDSYIASPIKTCSVCRQELTSEASRERGICHRCIRTSGTAA